LPSGKVRVEKFVVTELARQAFVTRPAAAKFLRMLARIRNKPRKPPLLSTRTKAHTANGISNASEARVPRIYFSRVAERAFNVKLVARALMVV
jgi:hypothetical protein